VPLKIIISTYLQNGLTSLSVRDNGMGLDLKMYGRKIFNLYQVFHRGYESKGVGLYIIKSQIEALGGSISVKSEVDKGSEFIVVFSS
jgi:signal transduction histidine kinase